MQTSKVAIDPLWQCLCPAWSQIISRSRPTRMFTRPKPRFPRNSNAAACRQYNKGPNIARLEAQHLHSSFVYNPLDDPSTSPKRRPKPVGSIFKRSLPAPLRYEEHDTPFLYGRLRGAAVDGDTKACREIAEFLVKERGEKPNVQLYNALILSNVHHEQGAAWRVHDLLEEMRSEGLFPDVGTCHAVLKVLAVHLDHLLRMDVLDYMQKRWYNLSEEGLHDIVAGMLREGLFEQALQRMDEMKMRGMRLDGWLVDMAVYTLCDAGEIKEGWRIMKARYDAGEMTLSRSLWYYLLDRASESRHAEATRLVWNSQVNQGFINPSSGTCLNVLATAARSGDAIMGTEVFSHLSKRGTAFEPIHYELLISTYLSTEPPDPKRAISILTIMPLEKLEPTVVETRSLYLYLRDKPELVKECFELLQELHGQERIIPIAVLNLLIECYVEQQNLPEAMKVYKLIHTFAPVKQGAQKSFANIDTFNLLLKGCRTSDPPDEQQASFLVSELLALRIVPTALTYDRLILVFLSAGRHALQHENESAEAERARGSELLDWAFRHFADMQPLGWMPRFGTLEKLATALAEVGDERCWDVLQVAEDQADNVEGFAAKGAFLRRNVEEGWRVAVGVGESESADTERESADTERESAVGG